MKIATLTFQYATNYGALLQAYALKQYLADMGNDVEILNYDTSFLYQQNRSALLRVKSFVWSMLRGILGGNKRIERMNSFRNSVLNVTAPSITTAKELNEYIRQFDALIVGSDQVWNPEIISRDTAYLLDLSNAKKKISYAASIGKSSIPDEWLSTMEQKLQSFDAISTREETAKELLERSGILKNIQVVVDPVFLLKSKKWEGIANCRNNNKKYILCYVMPGDSVLEKRIVSVAKQIKRETGLPIVYIGRKEYCQFLPDGEDIIDASPEEFVGLFAGADYVVTNSFHGTAFSLIFSKQFYSLVNATLQSEVQLGSRMVDLLHSVGLEDRIITGDTGFSVSKRINYSSVNARLDTMIEQSKNFLSQAL